jgi:hypothetical protein
VHTIWLDDFNRHHPSWDDPNDDCLFTNESTDAIEVLIEVIADAGLILALPSKILTHQHNITKRWTRLDQVFILDHSEDLVILCDTWMDWQGILIDHLPILTELDFQLGLTTDKPFTNFWEVAWDEF